MSQNVFSGHLVFFKMAACIVQDARLGENKRFHATRHVSFAWRGAGMAKKRNLAYFWEIFLLLGHLEFSNYETILIFGHFGAHFCPLLGFYLTNSYKWYMQTTSYLSWSTRNRFEHCRRMHFWITGQKNKKNRVKNLKILTHFGLRGPIFVRFGRNENKVDRLSEPVVLSVTLVICDLYFLKNEPKRV